MVRPLRIVRPYGHRGVEARQGVARPPMVRYHGGRLLTQVQAQAVFWGPEWRADPALNGLARQTISYLSWLVSGPYMDLLSEYSVAGARIARGTAKGPVLASENIPNNELDDAVLARSVDRWRAAGWIEDASRQTLLFVFLLPGVASRMGNYRSCADYCGYHGASAAGIAYAVLPYPDCPACSQGGVWPALTSVLSHELAEAVTDPVETGWYDDASGEEIGDLCEGRVRFGAGYQVQDVWSVRQGGCAGLPSTAAPAAWEGKPGWRITVEIGGSAPGRPFRSDVTEELV